MIAFACAAGRHIGLAAAENAAPFMDDDPFSTWCFDKLYPVYTKWRASMFLLAMLLGGCVLIVVIQKHVPMLSWIVNYWVPNGTMSKVLKSLGVAAVAGRAIEAAGDVLRRMESGYILFKKTPKEMRAAVLACEMAKQQAGPAKWKAAARDDGNGNK